MINNNKELKFNSLVKFLCTQPIDEVDKMLLAILNQKIITKTEYNDIIKRVIVSKNIKMGI